MVESRERRVMQQSVRAIVSSALGNADGAQAAYMEFSKALFPEQEQRAKESLKRDMEIIDKMGSDPIPVSPVTPTGSAWGQRFRTAKIRAGIKDGAS